MGQGRKQSSREIIFLKKSKVQNLQQKNRTRSLTNNIRQRHAKKTNFQPWQSDKGSNSEYKTKEHGWTTTSLGTTSAGMWGQSHQSRQYVYTCLASTAAVYSRLKLRWVMAVSSMTIPKSLALFCSASRMFLDTAWRKKSEMHAKQSGLTVLGRKISGMHASERLHCFGTKTKSGMHANEGGLTVLGPKKSVMHKDSCSTVLGQKKSGMHAEEGGLTVVGPQKNRDIRYPKFGQMLPVTHEKHTFGFCYRCYRKDKNTHEFSPEGIHVRCPPEGDTRVLSPPGDTRVLSPPGDIRALSPPGDTHRPLQLRTCVLPLPVTYVCYRSR